MNPSTGLRYRQTPHFMQKEPSVQMLFLAWEWTLLYSGEIWETVRWKCSTRHYQVVFQCHLIDGINESCWIYSISDRYYLTVTQPGCIPVHENVVSKKYGLIHTRLVRLLFTSFLQTWPCFSISRITLLTKLWSSPCQHPKTANKQTSRVLIWGKIFRSLQETKHFRNPETKMMEGVHAHLLQSSCGKVFFSVWKQFKIPFEKR